jgi:hypothetical protein
MNPDRRPRPLAELNEAKKIGYLASHIRIVRLHGCVLCATFSLRCGSWGKRAGSA